MKKDKFIYEKFTYCFIRQFQISKYHKLCLLAHTEKKKSSYGFSIENNDVIQWCW